MGTIMILNEGNIHPRKDICQDSVWGMNRSDLVGAMLPSEQSEFVAGLRAILRDTQGEVGLVPQFLKLTEQELDLVNNEILQLEQLEPVQENLGLNPDRKFLHSFAAFSELPSSKGPNSLLRMAQLSLIVAWLRLPGVKGFLDQRTAAVTKNGGEEVWLRSALSFTNWFVSPKRKGDPKDIWQAVVECLDHYALRELEVDGWSIELQLKSFIDRADELKSEGALKKRFEEIWHLGQLWQVLAKQWVEWRDAEAKAQTESKRPTPLESAAQRSGRLLRRRRKAPQKEYTSLNVPILNPTRERLEIGDEWSFNAYTALPVEMMRSVLDHLTPEVDDEDEERAVSAAILCLVGLTGASAHELIAALGALGEGEHLYRPLRFVRGCNGDLLLRFSPPSLSTQNSDEFKEGRLEGESESSAVLQGGWEFPVPTELATILNKWMGRFEGLYLDQQTAGRSSNKEKCVRKQIRKLQWRLVIGVGQFWYELRQGGICDLYTETRMRQGYLQQLLTDRRDPVLAQLVLGDHLGRGFSPLHYIRWRKRDIVDAMTRTAKAIAGGRLSFPEKEVFDDSFVATEIAEQSNEHFPRFGEFLSARLPKKVGRPGSEKRYLSEFNRAMMLAASAFIVATSHRNNSNLANIKAADISLDASVAMFRDKPSSPANYRRCAAFPSFVADCLIWYHGWLKTILDQAAAFEAKKKRSAVRLTDRARRLIEDAVCGEGTLFLELYLTEEKIDARPWVSTDFWGMISQGRLKYNSHRHYLSTYLRDKRLAGPMMIEAQLNHSVAAELVHDLGVVSLREFSEAMQGPLADILKSIGFPEEQPKRDSAALWEDCVVQRPVSDYFWKAHLAELRQDRADFSEQMGGADRNLQRSELVDGATDFVRAWIACVETELTDKKKDNPILPREVVLDAVSFIKSHAGGHLPRVRLAIREFREQLARLRRQYNIGMEYIHSDVWGVPDVPFYTKACAAAADWVGLLRRELMFDAETLKVDSLASFALSLILYGDVQSVEECLLVIKHLHEAKWVEGHDALVVSLPIYRPLNRLDEKNASASEQDVFDRRRSVGEKSFCLRGKVLQAATPLINGQKHQVSGRKLNALVNEALPNKFRANQSSKVVEHLIKTVRLERKVNLPPALASAASGEIVTRQMTADNLVKFELNGAFDCISLVAQNETLVERRIPEMKVSEDEIDGEVKSFLRDLRNMINEAKNDSDVSNDNLIAKVRAFKQRNTLGELGLMIVDFALHLCGPHINTLKSVNGEPYSAGTIDDYLGYVTPGIRIMADMGLDDYDPDEFVEMFRADRKTRNNREDKAKQIIRFFDHVASTYGYETPPLHGLAGVNFCEADINSHCFSQKEISLLPRALQVQFGDRCVSSLASSGKLAVLDILGLQSEYGLRSAEIDDLGYKDLQVHDGQVYLVIRDTVRRPLKTIASRRFIKLSTSAAALSFIDPNLVVSNRRLERSLIAGEVARKVSDEIPKLTKAAMTMVCGDTAARRHDLRGSRVSEELSKLFDVPDPVERMCEFEYLRTTIGHGAALSTFQNYGHNLQSITSKIRRSSLQQSAKRKGRPAHLMSDMELFKDDQKTLKNIKLNEVEREDKSHLIQVASAESKLSKEKAFRLGLQTVQIGFPAAARKLSISQSETLQFLQACRHVDDEFIGELSIFNSRELGQLMEAEQVYRLPYDYSRKAPGRARHADKNVLVEQENKVGAYCDEVLPVLLALMNDNGTQVEFARNRLEFQVDGAEYWAEKLADVSGKHGLLLNVALLGERKFVLQANPGPELKNRAATMKLFFAALLVSLRV